MKNVRKNRLKVFIGPNAMLVEMTAVFATFCVGCFAVTWKLGGPDHPVGAALLIIPAILIGIVLMPIIWEQMMKKVEPMVQLYSLRCQCAWLKSQNNRAIKNLRELKRKIFLGWLYS